MLRASRAHLAEVGESYFEHLRFALLVGALAVGAGLACMLHAVVPGICQKTCSRTVGLLQRLFADRGELPSVVEQSSGVVIFVILTALSSITALAIGLSGAGTVALIVVPQAFALPLIFLAQNPELAALSR
jgi:hypothetical protein